MEFTADYKAIAKGIFSILQDMAEKGDESYLTALAFGMMPAPLMEMAEKQLVEKLAAPSIRYGFPKEMAIKAVKEENCVKEFGRKLAVALLGVAKENNNLVV